MSTQVMFMSHQMERACCRKVGQPQISQDDFNLMAVNEDAAGV